MNYSVGMDSMEITNNVNIFNDNDATNSILVNHVGMNNVLCE